MKTQNCILVAAALLCGCNKKWEYRVVHFDNSARVEASEVWLSKTNTPTQWLAKISAAESAPGRFDLEARPPIAGLKSIDPTLNELGREGWELVAAIPQTETLGDAATDKSKFSNVRTGEIYLLFKRQK